MKIYALCPIYDSKALAPNSIWNNYDTASKLAEELNNLAKAVKAKAEFVVITYDLDNIEEEEKQ